MSKNKKNIGYNSIGWYLRALGMWMDRQMIQKLEPFGLTLDQFAIIMILFKQDRITQVEIGVEAMQPAYATTRNLDKLESLGYIRRHKHESSRRSHRVMLTDEGRKLVPALAEASRSVKESFLLPLEEEQKAGLLKTLSILSETCLLS
ncbi:MAG: DNA-binding MarR family transcriptional regulator [Desulforhopalus sp.]|jgi:DNA-binding MarR family transcriptional regulator